MKNQYDDQEGYCKMLGHFLSFAYCRGVNKGLPCSKVLDCWFQTFPVQDYIHSHYSVTEQEKIFTPPKTKFSTLTEILEQAQQRLKKEQGKE